jgi:hypothetical protein
MATQEGGVEVASPVASATQTLSQFVARVLDQLSLSAWLPSAALVLLLDFTFHLGAVLDSGSRPHNPADVTGMGLAAMGRIGVSGAVLLVIAVVVLTMLTQAFAFEAIRVLEGYWGTFRPVEWVASLRCAMHRYKLTRLGRRRDRLTEKALNAAVKKINARRQKPYVTPNMKSVLIAGEFGTNPEVTLTSTEEKRLRKVVWENYAPPDPMRRRVNVDKRIRDFPRADHVLPTRLGNILRYHEDKLDVKDIESFVQDVFDDLPPSLQQSHDEERNRLDLYCSMVFVLALSAFAALARLGPQHWSYALGVAAIDVVGLRVMYGAALATARAYGSVLLTIVKHGREGDSP